MIPAIDATLTMVPLRRASIAGNAALVQ